MESLNPPLEPRNADTAASDSGATPVRSRIAPVSAERLLENRIVAMADRNPAAIAYKVLRTHVLQQMRANNWKTLGVTSPTLGNGKTVTTINLAISLARDQKHTVLAVDLDLQRPSMAARLFDQPVPGLSDYITEDRPIEELLVKPDIERLVILPGSHSFTHSSEILCSPKMIELVNEIKDRYADRLILFDLPPVLGGDDVMAFAPYVDALLLVIEEGKTTKDQLTSAYELLHDRAKVLGTVLNKADEGSTRTGYSISY
ncbi:CpsD/CapB family tyrosine-protein kinase [Halochromatium glycolicum]|uniref:non-specific protein-tyrosine kinase n=1 Tax=Halochromatium glycolicum TaxID=85075 RepID=A0AAJ0U700_9GAMM|nr:CpsD/CapB family tyrosine-protein kinase [Halochromatium glycolicum]MBK1706363.1 exopolysaccharide biosynthesis protein [Halochromatium glycolicum]